ncbi:hypothetical protein PVAP13_3KG029700 [Panicum virgatum]|uniref:Uncharacterized protein n=1 Tax=Panicum virgatum TaxID=38727 RepID=A0A8T0UPR2_PANVG|nr:hypothetical protein PVAP13_3KG029700 [Panicum virgatum]
MAESNYTQRRCCSWEVRIRRSRPQSADPRPARCYLMLEELRDEHDSKQEAGQAFLASTDAGAPGARLRRSPTPPTRRLRPAATVLPSRSTRSAATAARGNSSGGGSSSSPGGGGAQHPQAPAPGWAVGFSPWTRLVQA